MTTQLPNCVDECYPILAHVLGSDGVERIKAMALDDLISLHFSVGRWIRNQWLHTETPLRSRLEKAGILIGEGDEISALILGGFWHALQGQPFDLAGALKRHHILLGYGRETRTASEIAGMIGCV